MISPSIWGETVSKFLVLNQPNRCLVWNWSKLSVLKDMQVDFKDNDRSTANPIPRYDKSVDVKMHMIVKFTRGDEMYRDEFYSNRKKVAGRKASSLKRVKDTCATKGVGPNKKIYISESLTPAEKKLFAWVNKLKKELKWKYLFRPTIAVFILRKGMTHKLTRSTPRMTLKSCVTPVPQCNQRDVGPSQKTFLAFSRTSKRRRWSKLSTKKFFFCLFWLYSEKNFAFRRKHF